MTNFRTDNPTIKEIHLVDGTFELFRGYFGAPSRVNASGQEIGATRALVASLLALLREGATHVGVAFDHVIESFRNDLFDGYKTGEGMDPLLYSQFPLAEDAVRALGVVVWPMTTFEADDALATAAKKFAPLSERVIICSPDKDLSQCLTDERVWMFDRIRKTLWNESGVKDKFGVEPEQIPDYLALVGDSADGIPGVKRWGAKSTATVLSIYPRLEEIPLEGDWAVKVRGQSSLQKELQEAQDEVYLYRELATLREDVPLQETVSDLRWCGPGPGWDEFCAMCGDEALRQRAYDLWSKRQTEVAT